MDMFWVWTGIVVVGVTAGLMYIGNKFGDKSNASATDWDSENRGNNASSHDSNHDDGPSDDGGGGDSGGE